MGKPALRRRATRAQRAASVAVALLTAGMAAAAPTDFDAAVATRFTATRSSSAAVLAKGATNQATSSSDWGATAADPCDPLDRSGCMLPFPNDYYTVRATSTPTGRRIYFPPGAFPTAAGAAAADVKPWEHDDGFSPGSTILIHVPGISLPQSRVASISDMGQSLDQDSPIVLLDATTGRRWPTWAELDADDPDMGTQLLIIHPAPNLVEGHRYIVVLRDLKTARDAAIGPSPAFAAALLGAPYHFPPNVAPLPTAYATHLKRVLATPPGPAFRRGVSTSPGTSPWPAART